MGTILLGSNIMEAPSAAEAGLAWKLSRYGRRRSLNETDFFSTLSILIAFK
jgi:hypothetical protein